MPLYEDSDRRCPYDGKRMMVEIGQEDVAEDFIGWVLMAHECWHCNYREVDRQWKRPKLTGVSGRSGAERLKALRLGEEIPMHYDTSPFPAGDLDAS